MASGFNRFDQLIEHWDPIIRQAFLQSVANMRDDAHLERIIQMLEKGDVEGALRAVGLDPTALRPLDSATRDAFISGGDTTAAAFPALIGADGFRVQIRFNIRNPAAERWLAERSATKVVEIIGDQRNMIREFLRVGMEQGVNPRTAALDLVGRVGASGRREGGVIGLTSSQSEWVRNYEAELTSNNPLAALERRLRDKRFDAAVIRAVKAQEPIPASLVAKMVTAYKNRALRLRAEGIARTEAIQSLHEAQQQAIEQAVASGAIRADQVAFVWRTAGDNRVRDSHEPMDGERVMLGEKFVTGAGNYLEYPGDPTGPPEEVINCRCWREPDINFLAGIT